MSVDQSHPIAQDLVLFYDFSDGSGSTVTDISGSANQHDGSQSGGRWDNFQGESVFDPEGGGGFVVPHHEDFGISDSLDFCVAVRMALEASTFDRVPIFNKLSEPGFTLNFAGWSSALEVWYGDDQETISAPTLADGELHLLTVNFERSTGTVSIRQDGELLGEVTIEGSTDNTADLRLGHEDPSGIDYRFYSQFGIWQRELTLGEIEDWAADPDLFLDVLTESSGVLSPTASLEALEGYTTDVDAVTIEPIEARARLQGRAESVPTGKWTTTYFPRWYYGQTVSRAHCQEMLEKCSHPILFATSMNPSTSRAIGEVDSGGGMGDDWNEATITAFVEDAHNAGKPAIFSVGGHGNIGYEESVMDREVRERALLDLQEYIETWGFDGIDYNYEQATGYVSVSDATTNTMTFGIRCHLCLYPGQTFEVVGGDNEGTYTYVSGSYDGSESTITVEEDIPNPGGSLGSVAWRAIGMNELIKDTRAYFESLGTTPGGFRGYIFGAFFISTHEGPNAWGYVGGSGPTSVSPWVQMLVDRQYDFDQINIMTYDALPDPWPGWVLAPNAGIYPWTDEMDGSFHHAPSSGNMIPCAYRVFHFLPLNFPDADLSRWGCGIATNGFRWYSNVNPGWYNPGEGPSGGWDSASPEMDTLVYGPHGNGNYMYAGIYHDFDVPANGQFHVPTASNMIQIDPGDPIHPGDVGGSETYRWWITYTDKESIDAFAQFMNDYGIGGLIVWDHHGDYFESADNEDESIAPLQDHTWLTISGGDYDYSQDDAEPGDPVDPGPGVPEDAFNLTDNYKQAVLDAFFRQESVDTSSMEISLHSSEPDDSGSGEISGGSYSRQTPSFDSASSGQVVNDQVLIFEDMPETNITHIGIWVDGQFWMSRPLENPGLRPAGIDFRINPGSLIIKFNQFQS